MAILHHKEEKIQVVLGRLPKKYTHEQFVEMFIKLYSKDWGKIKAAFIKQNQDREPGTVINMPKPDLYLKQLLETYIAANPAKAEVIEVDTTSAVKTKAASKKKVEKTVEEDKVAEKPKAIAKKKVTTEKIEEVAEPKKKAIAKKKVGDEEIAPTKAKKVKVEKK